MNNNKKPLDLFDVFSKYKPFEIIQVINNAVKIESQVIPYGTKKGYKVELIFNFEEVTDFEYKTGIEHEPKLHLTFSNAIMNIKEVDRE